MVAPADGGEAVAELREVHAAAELALENGDVSVAWGASLGGEGEAVVGREIGGDDLGDIIDVKIHLGSKSLFCSMSLCCK